MAVTYKSLPKIRFPVYILPCENWYTLDGLLFLENKILDDKNMPGDSLGKRRLQTPHTDNLKRLTKCYNTLPELLQSNKKFFIDYNGVPFQYEKTMWSLLKYYKIVEVRKKGTFSTLVMKGVPSPFIIKRPPPNGFCWVGILHLHGLPWMLYEYSREYQKPTHRKV